MRLIVQRVSSASVTLVDSNKTVGKIDIGLLVLVGVKKGDTEKDAEILAEKLSKLRVMADLPAQAGEHGKMNLTADNFLIVSQFTLYADTKGGNRPSFINAASPTEAREIYDYFVGKLKEKEVKVETGSFGDFMKIAADLNGPVTIILET